MKKIIIEPHYLGSLEFYCALIQADSATLEVNQHYHKQSYKNRAEILSPQGMKALTVPVKYNNRTQLKDVRIEYSQSWLRDHWGAFFSSYGKAPYFEYFSEDFRAIWDSKPAFLVELNYNFMTFCLKVLQCDIPVDISESYQKEVENGVVDLRDKIHPKISFAQRKFYRPVSYMQIFGDIFVPNLSIVDLIMCEGRNARTVLLQSAAVDSEQF